MNSLKNKITVEIDIVGLKKMKYYLQYILCSSFTSYRNKNHHCHIYNVYKNLLIEIYISL